MRDQTKLICIGVVFMVLLSGIIVAAVVEDAEGPLIYQIDVLPRMPVAGDVIHVVIYAIDSSGVSGAQLTFSNNGGDVQVLNMEFYACLCIAGGRWTTTIGPFSVDDSVLFFVTSFDDSVFKNPADTEAFTLDFEA